MSSRRAAGVVLSLVVAAFFFLAALPASAARNTSLLVCHPDYSCAQVSVPDAVPDIAGPAEQAIAAACAQAAPVAGTPAPGVSVCSTVSGPPNEYVDLVRVDAGGQWVHVSEQRGPVCDAVGLYTSLMARAYLLAGDACG